MNRSLISSRARVIVVLSAITAVTSTGCVSSPPEVEAERTLSQAAGLSEPITFRTIGAPTNEQPDAGALPFGEAIRLAIHTSPDIQSALARVRIAQADARQTRLLPNPILSVVLRFPQGGGSVDVDAGLSADLIQVLSLRGRAAAADQRLRAAATEAVSITLDQLAQVQQQYVEAQSQDALLAVLSERETTLDRLLEIARSRVDAGEATRLDTLALEAQRVELETEIRDRQAQRLDARLTLAHLIGQPAGTVDWTLPAQAMPTLPARSEREWVDTALSARPEIQQAEYELAALGADASLVRLSPFDGVSAGIEAERGEGDWAIGPGVSTPLPIFDFGQQRRAKADAAVIAARHDLTRARRQVVEDTRRAYAAVIASQENLRRVRDELTPLAQSRLDQAEAQFRSGQVDVTALLQAEEDLRSARIRIIELDRDAASAFYRLQRAVGGPGASQSPTTTQPAATASPSTTRKATR